MSNQKKKVRNAPRGSGYNSLLIILVSLILIGIPLYLLGSVVYDSYMESGEPILGERYTNDRTNEITDEQIENVKNTLASNADVENVSVNLQSGTLKVTADLRNDITVEQLQEVQVQLYNQIIGLLPVESYFTRTDTVKNYDLEISVFNDPNTLELHSIYVKNSTMSAPKANLVSTALNPEINVEPLPEGFDYQGLYDEAFNLNDQYLVDVTVEQIEEMIARVKTASAQESELKQQLNNILAELEGKLQRKLAQ